ncbi:hypothetical protein KEM56_003535, partial [Ascosphaera pollenicola]
MSSPRGDSSPPTLPAAGYRLLSSPDPAVYHPNQSGAAHPHQQQPTPLQIDFFEACFDASLSTPSRMAAASALSQMSNEPLPRPTSVAPASTTMSWNTASAQGLSQGFGSSGDPLSLLVSASGDTSHTNRVGTTAMSERARQSSLPIFAPHLVSSPVVSSASPTWSAGAGGPSIGVSSVNIPQQFAELSISGHTSTPRATPEIQSPSSVDGASASFIPQHNTGPQIPQRLSLNPFRNRILQRQEQHQQQQQHQQPLLISPVSSRSNSPASQSQPQPPHPMATEYTPPPWQPDSEVSACPICHHEFSFWYRKHHCRKCGRVVCANCSPHRITIPRQYIVRPPTSEADSPGLTGPGFPGGAVRKRGSLDILSTFFDAQESPSRTEVGGASGSAAGLQSQIHPPFERSTPTIDSLFGYFPSNQRPASQSSTTITTGNTTSVSNPALGGGEE